MSCRVALKKSMIDAIVQGYGDAARRMQTAGMDGVEIVASHGYLPAQFLNPRVNLRDDAYGGDLDGRLRFLREVICRYPRQSIRRLRGGTANIGNGNRRTGTDGG